MSTSIRVVGGGMHNPHDALVVGRRARRLGFTSTVGIIHDGDGQLQPLGDEEREVFLKMKDAGPKQLFARSITFRTRSRRASRTSGDAAPGRATFTSAKTAWCTTARSSAATPARRWRNIRWPISAANILTEKSCAPHCTVSCVHQVSYLDFWRAPQQPERACPRGIAAAEQVLRNHVPGSPMPQPTHRPSARPTTGLIQINTRPATE